MSIFAALVQVAGLIIWPVLNGGFDAESRFENTWALPVGLTLTSIGWWESFVTENDKFIGKVTKYLWKVRDDMFQKKTRYYIYFFVSLWKCFLFFCLFIAFSAVFILDDKPEVLFDGFKTSFKQQMYNLTTAADPDDVLGTVSAGDVDVRNLPAKLLATQIFTAYAAYIFAKFACKTKIQRIAFSIPAAATSPIVVFGVASMCKRHNADPCEYYPNLPALAFLDCPAEVGGFHVLADLAGWMWILLFVSQFWIALHIWFPRSQRLASTEQLFHVPYYNGLFVEQSVMFNRRSDDGVQRVRMDHRAKLEAHIALHENLAPGSSASDLERKIKEKVFL